MGTVLRIVWDIMSMELDDGLTLRSDNVSAQTIRDDDTYQGVRVSLMAELASAQIAFHVDVNIGDPIWPDPTPITLPGLLGRDVELIGYPLPMVHAEKIVTAIDRGPTNTRWRDFADVHVLSGRRIVGAAELHGSISRVATYRRVTLAPLARVLRGWDRRAQAPWSVWRRKHQTADPVPALFGDLLADVAAFVDPVLSGQVDAGLVWQPVRRQWCVEDP